MTQFVVFVVLIGCGVIEDILNSVPIAEQRWMDMENREKLAQIAKIVKI